MPAKPSRKTKRVAHNPPKREKAHRPSHQSIAELDAKRAAFDSQFEPYTPILPASATRRVGKPPTYCAEMADKFLELSALGHTAGAIAAVLGVQRETLNKWASSHPEFGEAYARGKGTRQFFYESHLIDIVRRGGDSTRMSAIKLGLLNVGGEDWKERLTAEHNVTFNLGDLIKQSMALDDKVIEGQLIEQPKDDESGH